MKLPVPAMLGALALGLLASPGHTQDAPPPAPPPLRLHELYDSLAARSPRVRAALASTRAAEARVPATRRLPDPELQFGLMNRQLPGLGPMPILGMTQLQLMQMIPFPGKLGLAGSVATAEARASAERAREVSWELRTEAAMVFYELYEADRSLEVAHATQELLRHLERIAQTMYAVGEGRQADVLRAQVEIARMTEEIARMEAMRAGAAARLNGLLDRPADTPVPSPELPAPPAALPALDSLHRLAAANRPMVRAGEYEVQAADASLRLARREIWPDLELGIQYGQQRMEGDTERMLSFMVGITLPIWAGSRQLQMRREADAMRQMAAADLAAMRADTRASVGRLHADLVRARRLGALYRGTVLPQAEQTVAAALAAYRTGQVDFMTLLDARMTVNQYRQELFRLEAEEGRALAELEMLIGEELLP